MSTNANIDGVSCVQVIFDQECSTRKLKPANRNVKAAIDPSTVIRSFNTWAFKREQPDDLKLMETAVSSAINRLHPIHFVLYWGKGPRNNWTSAEQQCAEFLKNMGERISAVYPQGAKFTLILTDTHAKLNGHDFRCIDQYFLEVKSRTEGVLFDTVALSEIVEGYIPLPSNEVVEDFCCPTVLEKLKTCAAKWFNGEGSSQEGAVEYYRMNMIERRAVENRFPKAIFVTFNSSEYRSLFPAKMPIFYMYSLRKGIAVKPWFITSAKECAA